MRPFHTPTVRLRFEGLNLTIGRTLWKIRQGTAERPGSPKSQLELIKKIRRGLLQSLKRDILHLSVLSVHKFGQAKIRFQFIFFACLRARFFIVLWKRSRQIRSLPFYHGCDVSNMLKRTIGRYVAEKIRRAPLTGLETSACIELNGLEDFFEVDWRAE